MLFRSQGNKVVHCVGRDGGVQLRLHHAAVLHLDGDDGIAHDHQPFLFSVAAPGGPVHLPLGVPLGGGLPLVVELLALCQGQLGLCELARGDYHAALAAFQSGMQIEGNDVMQSLLFNEAVAYEYLHDYRQASVLMESYLKTYPDDQVARREYEFLSTR